ncbi:MAG TPA: ATP-binding protein [Oculatellaceae cyanobacterium]
MVAGEDSVADLAFRERIMKNSRRVTVAAVVTVSCVIAGMGLTSYEQVLRAAQPHGLIAQSHKVIRQIELLEHAVQEAEDNQRGYILTGQDADLSAYSDKVKQIPDRLASVKAEVSGNPVQQQRISEVEPLIRAKIAELDQALESGKRNGVNAAAKVIISNGGNRSLERIKAGLLELKEEEENLFRQHMTTIEQQTNEDVTRIVILSFCRILFVLGVAYLINRSLEGILQSQHRLVLQYACNKIFSETDDAPDKMHRILATMCENLDLTAGAFWILDTATGKLRCTEFWSKTAHPTPEFEAATKKIGLAQGEDLAGKVWQKRAAIWVSDMTREQDSSRAAVAAKEGLHTGVGFVIPMNQDELAVIELFDRKRKSVNRDLVEVVSSCGVQIGLSLTRAKMRKQLSESERRFRQMADNIQEIFFIIDSQGATPAYVSPGYEKIFGRSVSSLFEEPKQFFQAILPDDRDKVANQLRHQRQATEDSQTEFRIIHPERGMRWLWARLSSITDERGQLTGLCGAVVDITERKEADKRVSEFYSTVSHELRTPLTSIRGSLGLLEGGIAGAITPKARALVEIGRVESDRLIRLINDILDIKKIETGNFTLKKVSIDIDELVSESLEGIMGMATQANVALESSVTAKLKIQADRDRVLQVLNNLLSNAIKFSQPKTTAKVCVVDVPETGMVRFSVTDQGPGIKDEDRHKLFGMFQQIDQSDSRAKGGSGLGLSISKAIVEKHGGTIGLETEVGRGSTFWFELPAQMARPL